jgi:hypothetical protein
MTEEEYNLGLTRLDELWDTEDATEIEELNKLADQLDAYEQKHFPIRKVTIDFSTLP